MEDEKMENNKFQDLVIKTLKEQDSVQELFAVHFSAVENQFKNIIKKLDRLEELSLQNHKELELVVGQAGSLQQEVKDILKSKFYMVKVSD